MKQIVLKTLSGGLPALVVLLGLAANSAPAVPLAGGQTDVTLDGGFLSTLTGAGITPSIIAPGTLNGVVATFPISGGTDVLIEHTGGLSFSGAGNVVDIENFLIDVNQLTVFGDVSVNSSFVTNADLFNVNAGDLSLTLTSAASGVFSGQFGTPDLSGALVGVASPMPQPVPEPTTTALLGAGLLAFAFLRRRRS